MDKPLELATIKLQISLNKKLLDDQVISYEMYQEANDIFLSRYEQAKNNEIEGDTAWT